VGATRSNSTLSAFTSTSTPRTLASSPASEVDVSREALAIASFKRSIALNCSRAAFVCSPIAP